ncbi:unnamed protein product [Linum trigynum]|uniref:Uncharacterized protein n=1 Tax=Linum trigynum TaxID=586398 RepID=A0AAV2GNE6_9ROSI
MNASSSSAGGGGSGESSQGVLQTGCSPGSSWSRCPWTSYMRLARACSLSMRAKAIPCWVSILSRRSSYAAIRDWYSAWCAEYCC